MGDKLWGAAMSPPPGTISVEQEVGKFEQQGQELNYKDSGMIVYRKANKHSGEAFETEQDQINTKELAPQIHAGAKEHIENGPPQRALPQTRSEILIATHPPGGLYNQEQQLEQYISDHRREKCLRNIVKEKEEFRKADAYEFMKRDALIWLSGKYIFPLPERMEVGKQFPLHVFPSPARKWIDGIACAYGVHQSIGGALLLGILSICAGGKFKVRRHAEHVELMTLYQLIMMSSGKGKSPMLETALQPIKALEKRLQDEYLEVASKRNHAREIFSKRILKIKNEAAKGGDLGQALEEIAKLEKAMPKKIELPQLMTSKFTPEGLEKEAAKQGGKFALVGAELGSFKNLSVKKDDFILQAWAGERFVYSKVKDPIRIEDPCLTILIATQEGTSVNLLGAEALQEDGLVARFMPLVPPNLNRVAPGGGVTTAMGPEHSAWLERTVNEVYSRARPIDGHHEFRIQDGALRNWDAFWSYTQQQAEDESKPAVLQAWYRKLAGTALRFAGFLHLLRCQEDNLPLETKIDQQVIDGGIELARFYEAHALVALDLKGNDVLQHANKLLDRIKEVGSDEVTMREIYWRKHIDADDAKRAFRLLAEHGYVAPLRKGKSDICLINPRVWTMPMTS